MPSQDTKFGSQTGPIVRRATPADLPTIGRLGALLIKEPYGFDPRRFLPARPGTPEGYASFISTQLEDPDKAVLVADDNRGRGRLRAHRRRAPVNIFSSPGRFI